MNARTLIPIVLILHLGSIASRAQVSVQVIDPMLEPGESTTVVIAVTDVNAECAVYIYGVHTATLVNFKDTTVHLPQEWPDDLPFIITLPVQALPNVFVVWGEYLIVAEIIGTAITPEIIALSPGQFCSGSVPTGHLEAEITFTWEARGQFTQFEVLISENPCGKYPPGTPTTPPPTTPTPNTPTPSPITPSPTTPTPQQPGSPTTGPANPSQPIPADTPTGDVGSDTDTPLPALPPGWEWTQTGPYWTGEHPPEPPALPPGWEWGPLYPQWTGTGQPCTAPIIATSEVIPSVSDIQTGASFTYSQTVNVSSFLQPGAAFVYQIYGITETSDGTTTGVLSETMCDRYSPEDHSTGVPTEPVPCPVGPTCQIMPKTLVDPLMDGGLKKDFKVKNLKIKRDDFLPLGAEGKDYDQLEWECLPSNNCEETRSKKTIPLTGRVKYKWEILNGEGNFVQLGCLPDIKTEEGEHVIFQTPYVPIPKDASKPEKKETEILLSVIDDNSTQPIDKIVERKIKIITERRKGDDVEDFYYVTVESADYKIPAAPTPKTEDGTCKAEGPTWENKDDLKKPSENKPPVQDNDKMVVGQWMRMNASDQRDNDHVKVFCNSSACESTKHEQDFEDNVEWKWEIITAGESGNFIIGPEKRAKSVIARYVIYEAPPKIPDNKPYLDVEIEIEVFNPEGLQIVDTKPPKHKFKLRIYKAGIELDRTPAKWLPEKDNSLDLTSMLKYHDGTDWQDALAHMCRIHFFELNGVTKEKGYCTNAPAEKDANTCFDLRLKNEKTHEAFTKSAKPGKPTSTGCKAYKDYLVESRTQKPERKYTITVHSEDYGAFGTLLSHGNINIYNPAKQKNEKPVYTSIPDEVEDHPQGRKKKTLYEDNRVTIPRDIDENHIADNGWRAAIGNGQQRDPADVKVDEDDSPAGDGYKSDGYTGYEEYRGFDVVEPKAEHIRTDMKKKDLLVWNEGAFDVSRFRDASALIVHIVDKGNLLKTSAGIYMANFNSPTFTEYAQAGLRLCNGSSSNCSGDDKALGIVLTTTKDPAPPNWVYRVVVYRKRIEKLKLVEDGFLTYADKAQQVVAHELGHAVNTYHHGERLGTEDNPDYNNIHGVRSGDVTCIMRYDNMQVQQCQNLAETEITVGGKRRKARVEPTGTIFCTDAAGTGYNANNQCFGNCAAGRGDCVHQFRVSGRDAGYPKR